MTISNVVRFLHLVRNHLEQMHSIQVLFKHVQYRADIFALFTHCNCGYSCNDNGDNLHKTHQQLQSNNALYVIKPHMMCMRVWMDKLWIEVFGRGLWNKVKLYS